MPKWATRSGTGIILLAVAFFVWRAVNRHWTELSAANAPALELHIGWILAAAITILFTYLILIAAWRMVLRGWEQELHYLAALRIWCLSNLGRYLPGKVWAVAGMAVLAKQQGVDGWAAGASALVMQALAVTTGAAVVIATLPALGTNEPALNPVLIGTAVTLGIVGLTTLTVPRFTESVKRLTNGRFEPRPLALSAVAAGAASTLLSWLAYGFAFWLLARGVTSDITLTLPTAIGSFAAGYVVGLLAVFVPGGFGVREGVFFVLLAPQIGGPAALMLAAASRLLMTATEISAAVIAYPLPQGRGH